jgi:hypothetical protein
LAPARTRLTPPAEAATSQKWKIIYLQVLSFEHPRYGLGLPGCGGLRPDERRDEPQTGLRPIRLRSRQAHFRLGFEGAIHGIFNNAKFNKIAQKTGFFSLFYEIFSKMAIIPALHPSLYVITRPGK